MRYSNAGEPISGALRDVTGVAAQRLRLIPVDVGRQLRFDVDRRSCVLSHVMLFPGVGASAGPSARNARCCGLCPDRESGNATSHSVADGWSLASGADLAFLRQPVCSGHGHQSIGGSSPTRPSTASRSRSA